MRSIARDACLVFADVLVPDFGVGADVISHERDAFAGREVVDLDAVVAQPVDASLEGLAFTDDDGAEAKLADESCAVPAGGEGGDHNQVSIRALAAGVAEGIGLRVSGWVVVLDTSIVATSDQGAEDGAVGTKDGGPYGDASFGEAKSGFRDGDGEHGVRIHTYRV